MGNLCYLPIQDYRLKYNLKVFVETGAAGGGGIDTGVRAGFKRIYSCELDHNVFIDVNDRFKHMKNVNIFEGVSYEVLPTIFACFNSNVPTMFWLDAHLPINHENLEQNTILPLENELNTIIDFKDISKDVIIIDDIIMYDKDFQERTGFNLQDHTSVKVENMITVDGILNMFPNHRHEIDYFSEGYLTLLPK